MSRVAIYAGSFDPVTVGHVDLIRRGAALYDDLIVAVGHNPSKAYWFPLETRTKLIADVVGDLDNVRVLPFSGLLVEAAAQNNADVILRGLRALSDFDLEFRNGLANRDLSGIETVFLLTDPRNIFVSSSLVKEIAVNGGDVSNYVPSNVVKAIGVKLAQS
jgi:pantetheine-phosphate adenylyltransferase